MFSLANMPSTTSVISSYKTFAAGAMLARTVINERPIRKPLPNSQATLIIDEFSDISVNEIYQASETYLSTRITPSVEQLKVSKSAQQNNLSITINKGEKLIDGFEGIKLVWNFCCTETRRLEFDYELKSTSLEVSENKSIQVSPWGSVVLHHPSTFDTLAMDPKLKEELIDDLVRFVKRKEFYGRVGKAWKSGYLFNSEHRKPLVSTANQPILVIKDIDCSTGISDRKRGVSNNDSQLTLSGFLNFIDGLLSSCGDERIIMDKLDPALLRPGRMNMHINMSYCTPSGFKILASNYLGTRTHYPSDEIEELIK
ncbi:hypothetical protein ACFX13_011953 [Malus domestica]